MMRYRLTPRGFAAFISTAVAQRRHLRQSWSAAIRVAWHYGPIR